jgi:protein-disulfide isomerase
MSKRQRGPARGKILPFSLAALVAASVAAMLLWPSANQSEPPPSPNGIMKDNRAALFDDPHSPVDGNPQGDVTIVEFLDYNCHACRRMAPILAEARNRDPGLRIIYKEFPIRGPDSTLAAKAALAAHRQGKYLEFHNALISSRGHVTQAVIQETAQALELDVERLFAEMEDPAIARQIERNRALAQQLGITGTPGLVIGSEVRSGLLKLPALETWIAQERKDASAGSSSTGRPASH